MLTRAKAVVVRSEAMRKQLLGRALEKENVFVLERLEATDGQANVAERYAAVYQHAYAKAHRHASKAKPFLPPQYSL